MNGFFRHALFGAATVVFATSVGAAANGVPTTPDRTSVEAGFTQIFGARFTDAAGRPAVGESIRFSNDACGSLNGGGSGADAVTDANGIATVAFTALQPGGTVCTMAARAGAEVLYRVYTYRLNQVAIIANAPADPVPGLAFKLPVDVRMGIYSLPNVDVTARVVQGTGSARITPATQNSGPSGGVTFTVEPEQPGDFEVEVALRTLTKRVPIRYLPAAEPVHQDMWFDPAENGWGVSIVEHRNVLFMVLYAYDPAGKPTWYVISSGTWNAARTAFTGAIHAPRGSPFYAYEQWRFSTGPSIGTATITFADSDHAVLDYAINNVSGRKNIQRFHFGPPAAPPLSGLTDMWWGGSSQNGWGISLVQQHASLFAMWYTYDEGGSPTWFAMPAGSWTSPGTYEGRLYRTTGSPWLGRAYDASLFRPVDVGSFRLRFAGDAATFEYAIEGRTGVLPLTRFLF